MIQYQECFTNHNAPSSLSQFTFFLGFGLGTSDDVLVCITTLLWLHLERQVKLNAFHNFRQMGG